MRLQPRPACSESAEPAPIGSTQLSDTCTEDRGSTLPRCRRRGPTTPPDSRPQHRPPRNRCGSVDERGDPTEERPSLPRHTDRAWPRTHASRASPTRQQHDAAAAAESGGQSHRAASSATKKGRRCRRYHERNPSPSVRQLLDHKGAARHQSTAGMRQLLADVPNARTSSRLPTFAPREQQHGRRRRRAK